jgi:hypothetical protein
MDPGEIPLQSVCFWDEARKRMLWLPGNATLRHPGLIPLPGDRITLEDEVFDVRSREFRFHQGCCFVTVNLQIFQGTP